jgi:hypothetical protein
MHARAWRVRQVGRDSRSVLRPSAATWGPVRGVAPEALADGGTPMTEQARGGLCGLGSAFWTGHLIRTTVHHNWTGVDNGASSDLPARWIRVHGVVAYSRAYGGRPAIFDGCSREYGGLYVPNL